MLSHTKEQFFFSSRCCLLLILYSILGHDSRACVSVCKFKRFIDSADWASLTCIEHLTAHLPIPPNWLPICQFQSMLPQCIGREQTRFEIETHCNFTGAKCSYGQLYKSNAGNHFGISRITCHSVSNILFPPLPPSVFFSRFIATLDLSRRNSFFYPFPIEINSVFIAPNEN